MKARTHPVRPATNLLALLLLACVCLPVTAHAATSPHGTHPAPAAQSAHATQPPASLHVSFAPERLGHSTTLEFTAQIAASPGHVLPPLSELNVLYPSTLGVDVGELGLASCEQSTLEAFGPASCPADSRMGEGSALAEIPIGPEMLHETAQVAIVRAPESEEHLALLLYATGSTPVFAQIAFPGLLLPAPAPYGARIHIDVPAIPGLPGGLDVAILRLHATLGPKGLTYSEHAHGRLVSYKPRGILLPRHCPRRGFAFSATFTFQNGDHAVAHTTVPCPH